MNRRNFLISGGTALAGLFLANGISRLDADSHATHIDEHINERKKSMKTAVSIVDDAFYINGEITYPGRSYQDHRIEGLLINTRMVQGIFDDRNPETVHLWEYPDTGEWDAERNAREFLAAMPTWRAHGVLAFTINLQGGSPEGYSKAQPWHNSGIEADGSLNRRLSVAA